MLADHLNHYNFYLNDPHSFSFDLNRYSSVTTESISKIANEFLTKKYLELRISPE